MSILNHFVPGVLLFFLALVPVVRNLTGFITDGRNLKNIRYFRNLSRWFLLNVIFWSVGLR